MLNTIKPFSVQLKKQSTSNNNNIKSQSSGRLDNIQHDTVSFSGLFSPKTEEKLPWVVKTAANGNWQALHDAIDEGELKHTLENVEAIKKGMETARSTSVKKLMQEALEKLQKKPLVKN